jgi:hypothetical protein
MKKLFAMRYRIKEYRGEFTSEARPWWSPIWLPLSRTDTDGSRYALVRRSLAWAQKDVEEDRTRRFAGRVRPVYYRA